MTQTPDFANWVGELAAGNVDVNSLLKFSLAIQGGTPPVVQTQEYAKLFIDDDGDFYAFITSDTGKYVEGYYADSDEREWMGFDYMMPTRFLTEEIRAGIGQNLPKFPEEDTDEDKAYSEVFKWREEFYAANDQGVHVWLSTSSQWILAPAAGPMDYNRMRLYVECRNNEYDDGLPPDPYSSYNNFYDDDEG